MTGLIPENCISNMFGKNPDNRNYNQKGKG
jgi:hypothetical protein